MVQRCFDCEEERPESEMTQVNLYDTPWEDAPHLRWVCNDCEEFLEDHFAADFRYFECPICNRRVCEQNPHNGYHVQYRLVEDELWCLKCYQDELLAHGLNKVGKEALARGLLPGMFFKSGNPELIEAGYQEIGNRSIRSAETAEAVAKEALDLMAQGYKVIVAYERLAIEGSEGHVSLWSKEGRADGAD